MVWFLYHVNIGVCGCWFRDMPCEILIVHMILFRIQLKFIWHSMTVMWWFTVKWNKKIWWFSAISLNFWLTSKWLGCLVQWEEAEIWLFRGYVAGRHIYSCESVISVFATLKSKHLNGVHVNLIQISLSYLNLDVVSRFHFTKMPCNNIIRQMRVWLGIHVSKFFSSVFFP